MCCVWDDTSRENMCPAQFPQEVWSILVYEFLPLPRQDALDTLLLAVTEGPGSPLEWESTRREALLLPPQLQCVSQCPGTSQLRRGRNDSLLLSLRLELWPCKELHKAKSPSSCWAWSCAKTYFYMLSTVRKIKALFRGGNNNYWLELTSASKIASPPSHSVASALTWGKEKLQGPAFDFLNTGGRVPSSYRVTPAVHLNPVWQQQSWCESQECPATI